MRLIELSYQDHHRKWGFSKLQLSRVTLLVGVSGVGKTQILRSISNLKRIANGYSFNGLQWSVTFEHNSHTYIWSGKFECIEDSEVYIYSHSDINAPKCKLISESITIDGASIVERNNGEILYNKNRTIELPDSQSVAYLLRSTPEIKPLYDAFMLIFSLGAMSPKFSPTQWPIKELGTNNQTELIASYYPVSLKLYEAHIKKYKVYDQIKRHFTSIFCDVEDIRIGYFTKEKDSLRIQIKEKFIDGWIDQSNISSGMMRTLSQLSQVLLSPPGSVILIDEFENSLGVNCIDILTNELIDSSNNTQFIITSHHPYIINNISPDDWKIVTRKGGEVTIKNATELKIGHSSHDAFIQLINAIN